ncbi:MAG TPA: hypothetical protein VN258_19690 [Mobilitalea sp.]|nr:hypothetical protein [Mobilitalea sp.]
MKKLLCFGLVMFLITISCSTAYAGARPSRSDSYLYQNGVDVSAPAAYNYEKSISLVDNSGKSVANPQDMFLSEDGLLYILDTDNGRILIYNSELSLVDVLDTFTTADGKREALKKPEGLFVTADNKIYIADTENNRILETDTEGNVLNIFGKPEGLIITSTETYLPIRIVVDSAGRMSVVARNINMGIIQMTPEGKFVGYTGTPKVKVDIFTKFWKSISSKKVKDKLSQFVPTEYSNMTIDKKGFIYGTISSLSASDVLGEIQSKARDGQTAAVKRINLMGDDILRRLGDYTPLGDLYFNETPSKIIDVALGSYEIYSLLDSTEGRIFTYDSFGNMLYIFGDIGNEKGNFVRPVSLLYMGQKVVVLDSVLNELIIFDITDYGLTVLNAVGTYYDGEYTKSYEYWSQVASENSNFQYAFIGLGKSKVEQGLYAEAMKYFEYAKDKKDYSIAKEKLRKEQLKVNFPIAFYTLLTVCILSGLIKILRKFLKYYRGE